MVSSQFWSQTWLFQPSRMSILYLTWHTLASPSTALSSMADKVWHSLIFKMTCWEGHTCTHASRNTCIHASVTPEFHHTISLPTVPEFREMLRTDKNNVGLVGTRPENVVGRPEALTLQAGFPESLFEIHWDTCGIRVMECRKHHLGG